MAAQAVHTFDHVRAMLERSPLRDVPDPEHAGAGGEEHERQDEHSVHGVTPNRYDARNRPSIAKTISGVALASTAAPTSHPAYGDQPSARRPQGQNFPRSLSSGMTSSSSVDAIS